MKDQNRKFCIEFGTIGKAADWCRLNLQMLVHIQSRLN